MSKILYIHICIQEGFETYSAGKYASCLTTIFRQGYQVGMVARFGGLPAWTIWGSLYLRELHSARYRFVKRACAVIPGMCRFSPPRFYDPGGTAIPGQPVADVEQAPYDPPLFKNQFNICCLPVGELSDVKLIRTDTTLWSKPLGREAMWLETLYPRRLKQALILE